MIRHVNATSGTLRTIKPGICRDPAEFVNAPADLPGSKQMALESCSPKTDKAAVVAAKHNLKQDSQLGIYRRSICLQAHACHTEIRTGLPPSTASSILIVFACAKHDASSGLDKQQMPAPVQAGAGDDEP